MQPPPLRRSSCHVIAIFLLPSRPLRAAALHDDALGLGPMGALRSTHLVRLIALVVQSQPQPRWCGIRDSGSQIAPGVMSQIQRRTTACTPASLSILAAIVSMGSSAAWPLNMAAR